MGIPALFSICSGDSYPFIYEALRRKLAKNSSGMELEYGIEIIFS
jgi:hypothetical protein